MTLSRYRIDKNGRECTKCIEYKPWKNEDGTTNFTRDFRTSTGYGSWCKACKNEQQLGSSLNRDTTEHRCRRCGAPIEKPTARLCQECRTKSWRLAQGNWYLCLRDPSRLKGFLGRMLGEMTLGYSLKDGNMPEGMLLQHIAWGKPQGLHVVRGKALHVQWLEECER